MSRFLPDRERRHLLQFHVAKRMPYGRRLILAAGLVLSGIAIQVILIGEDVVLAAMVGGPFVLIGNLFLLLRGYNLFPDASDHGGEWETTTLDRFEEVLRLEEKVRRWDETFIDATCVKGFLSLLVVILAIGAGAFLLAGLGSGKDLAILFGVDAALLVLPHWFSGLRRKWRPVALRQRIEALFSALDAIEGFDSPPRQVQARLFVTGRGDKRVPADARLFIRFPDGPEDLLGLQFQVAVNDVQGTSYPYLYAVIVAKPGFELLDRHLADAEDMAGDLTVEASRERDVEVIVIRQHTTEKSGYHTKPRVSARIALTAWAVVERLLSVETRG